MLILKVVGETIALGLFLMSLMMWVVVLFAMTGGAAHGQ